MEIIFNTNLNSHLHILTCVKHMVSGLLTLISLSFYDHYSTHLRFSTWQNRLAHVIFFKSWTFNVIYVGLCENSFTIITITQAYTSNKNW